MALNGLACYAEVGGRREHVAIIGPHNAFSDFVCRREVYCLGGADEEIARTGNHPGTRPSQQSFRNGNEVPQSVPDVLGKARRQFAPIAGRRHTFTHAAMKNGVELGQGP